MDRINIADRRHDDPHVAHAWLSSSDACQQRAFGFTSIRVARGSKKSFFRRRLLSEGCAQGKFVLGKFVPTQVSATVAAALGEDFTTSSPGIHPPLPFLEAD